MDLPFAENALEPTMTKDEVHIHHAKHHKAYVEKLNKIIKDTEFESMKLEQIISKSKTGPIFNNSAQIWNHNMFWKSLSADSKFDPNSNVGKAIVKEFKNLDGFKKAFEEKAKKFFGSGWAWLILKDGKINIVTTSNAHNPISSNEGKLLLAIDLWEHSFLYDPQYEADRAKYLKNIWQIINWEFAEENL